MVVVVVGEVLSAREILDMAAIVDDIVVRLWISAFLYEGVEIYISHL